VNFPTIASVDFLGKNRLGSRGFGLHHSLKCFKEAAEKLQNLGEVDGMQSSRPKGRVDFIAFTPEINLRPTLKPSFSAWSTDSDALAF
jgi:hypothetical protein